MPMHTSWLSLAPPCAVAVHRLLSQLFPYSSWLSLAPPCAVAVHRLLSQLSLHSSCLSLTQPCAVAVHRLLSQLPLHSSWFSLALPLASQKCEAEARVRPQRGESDVDSQYDSSSPEHSKTSNTYIAEKSRSSSL